MYQRLPEPEPGTALAVLLALVGERRKVLEVGCGSGALASLLATRQCDVFGIESSPSAAEEARRYCTDVLVVDLDRVSLSETLADLEFDVVVFADSLTRLREPVRVLDEARALLGSGGYVVAAVPNVSHGAMRLSLLAGRFEHGDARLFTAKTLDEMFVAAGYRLETIERVEAPIFSESEGSQLSAADVDAALLAEIERDPESRTIEFVVKALPLSNDQRTSTLLKRFLAANSELADSRQRLTGREAELVRLGETVASQEAEIDELHARLASLMEEINAGRERERRFAEAREEFFERLLAAQADRARVAESAAELRAQLGEAQRTRETLEAQLRDRYEADRYVAEFESDVATQQRLSDLETQLRQAQSDLERERGRVLSLERQLREDAGTLERRNAELSVQIEELRQAAARLPEPLPQAAPQAAPEPAAEPQIDERDLRINHLDAELMAAIDAVHQRDGEIAELQAERDRTVAELQAALQANRSEIDAAQGRVEELEAERAALQTELEREIAARENVQARLRALEGSIESSGAILRDQERLLSEAQAKAAALHDELGRASERSAAQIRALEESAELAGKMSLERLQELERTRAELSALQASAAELQSRNTDMFYRIGELEDQQRDAETRAATALARVSELETAEREQADELAVLRDLVPALENKLEASETRIAELQSELARYADVERQLEDALHQRETALQDLEAARLDRDGAVAEAQKRYEQAERQFEAEIGRLEAAMRVIGAERDGLIGQNDSLQQRLGEAADRLTEAQFKTQRLEDLLEATREQGRASEELAARSLVRQRSSEHALSSAREAVEIARTEVDGFRERATALEQTVRTMQTSLRESRARADELAHELSLAKVGAATAEARAIENERRLTIAERHLEESSRRAADLETDLATARRDSIARMEAERRVVDLEGEVSSLRVRQESLEEALSETRRRLVKQTEELLISAQAQTAEYATLIDTVQSSRFWKIKRWLMRYVLLRR
ncbi:MAG TPA: methyltransferase domain-containing protein [Candidatus Acidoferrales bacterium]|nr:methyltransferase domain-containing protein [Candidatus Acidoferrales bacterium]